jgi:hypothetical protein
MAIAYNAAMNMGCRCFFNTLISSPFHIYLEEGLLDHMVVVFNFVEEPLGGIFNGIHCSPE